MYSNSFRVLKNIKMGETFVKCKITNPKTSKGKEIDFLVDTGASLPVIPENILKELGIEPKDKDKFKLATGKIKTFKIGEVEIKLNGKQHIFPVVFGSMKSQPLLGLVVLETFGYKVDPTEGKLIKGKLLMYKISRENEQKK